MPRYYQHLRDGDELIEDLEGGDFDDLPAVLLDAQTAAREMLSEKVLHGRIVDGTRIEICDDAGALVETVKFREQLYLKEEDRS